MTETKCSIDGNVSWNQAVIGPFQKSEETWKRIKKTFQNVVLSSIYRKILHSLLTFIDNIRDP
jgi:hypothetical protein